MDINHTKYKSFTEIGSQPEAWSELIPLILEKAEAVREIFSGVEEVIFTGCGSGLNVSMSGAAVMQAKAHIPSRAVPAFDVDRFTATALNPQRKTLAFLSSRSGKTTEVVNAMRHLQQLGIKTLGVTCSQGSPLALESDLAFVLSPVVEQAVITTRSLTGMILVTQLIAAVVAHDEAFLAELKRLPELCAAKMSSFHALGKAIGGRTDLTRYSFLANGPLFGIAHECQLKVKEMVLVPADCYPALDFRHGPQSNVDGQMLVTVFFTDSAGEEEARLLKDMKALNGVTLAVCDKAVPGLAEWTDYLIEVESGLGEYSRGILYMPVIHYLAYYRAIAGGLNPDEPHNLSYWIDTSR